MTSRISYVLAARSRRAKACRANRISEKMRLTDPRCEVAVT